MPKRKSAEDIRRQTNRICGEAMRSLTSGRIDRREFGVRIARVTDMEKRYTDNIHRQPQYLIEIRHGVKGADATPYLRSVYMYEGVRGV